MGKKQDLSILLPITDSLWKKGHTETENEGMKKIIIHANGNETKAGGAILISKYILKQRLKKTKKVII